MNKKVILFTFILGLASLITACDSDDDTNAKPEITILELGDGESHGDERTAKIGGELHMEIEVVAEGKIDKIQVRLHPEGEHHKSGEEGEHEEWEIDTTYTKFSGLRNTTFHEHLEIDLDAEPGDYHFDFVVTDMEGNQTDAEAEIEIIEE
ncbi:DUF4625 domain-containing protein [Marinifilum caeruleilacunae]|jgi:major membrane immunogen (membrane-anchored lipoprotein)|uniref:DUF4625 domain-containing protein n=1 Tax=Marinifilum caeruleilacunae TaxID=2499076 RepID=A0ABX1X0M0_9BACT|nr:DUF4625 domain-containing protein [Marinifilum caeruleilacunae]NOU61953.1 DUF4625 domain-containing protein [Marinifilum caeruleilacunae]